MSRSYWWLLLLFSVFLLPACENPQEWIPFVGGQKTAKARKAANPPAEGFDEQGSDAKAVAIADEVMQAMGGRDQWDKTRYLEWNFFGMRTVLWDKKTGNLRIDSHQDTMLYLTNIHTAETGRIWRYEEEITHPDSINKYLPYAHDYWRRDSYWLLLPYKLKDTGVTLQYAREDTCDGGKKCDVLQLTFVDVGDNPQNKYEVYVDRAEHLVKRWSYFYNQTDTLAIQSLPWDNYKQYGNILLAGVRSDGFGPSELAVYDSISVERFKEP